MSKENANVEEQESAGSTLYRYTDLPLDKYPLLSWDWFIETPVTSDIDETAKAGDDNAGRWHDESADLRALYRKNWGDPGGARLVEVALFCDTDATGGRSVAYFSAVRVERAP